MKKLLALLVAILIVLPASLTCVSADDYEDSVIALMGDANENTSFDADLSLESGSYLEGSELSVRIGINNISASELVEVELDFFYNADVLELIYDPDEDIGDESELLLDNFAVHPGRATSWESLTKFRPDTEPGVIHLAYATTAKSAAAKNDGDLYIVFPFTVIGDAQDRTAIYIANTDLCGSDFDLNKLYGNGSYIILEPTVFHTVTFVDDDGTVISEEEYEQGADIEIPDDPEKPADDTYTYEFAGWSPDVSLICEGDATYTATYTATYIDYTVQFVDCDGSVISEETYHYGDDVTVPDDPTRDADNTYTYEFLGWSPDVSETCQGNATYTAVYGNNYINYLVRFLDYNGQILSQANYHYGDPLNVPTGMTRPADDIYTYEFSGWSPALPEVCEGAADYTAVYTPTYIDYTVTFYDYDGSVIAEQTYHYGDAIVPPEDPVRASDNTYDYQFAGWSPDVASECQGDDEYTAQYTSEYIEYTVRFFNYNGALINTAVYHHGDGIVAPGGLSRDPDETYTYEFSGWSPELPQTCTASADYTAVFTATYIDYTVKFFNYNGELISSANYHYGDTVTAPDDPEKPGNETYEYVFTGWDPAFVAACSGNAEYTAVFEERYIDYTVRFLDHDETVISSATYHYGDPVNVPADPTRNADDTYTYEFAGWTPAVVENCTGDATYTATYTPTYIDYTVKFIDYDNRLISETDYHYGDEIAVPDDPERAEDDNYSYVFNGWTPEVSATCEGDATYQATYTAIPKAGSVDIAIDHANGINEGGVSVVFGGDTVESAILAVKPADYVLGDVSGDGRIEAIDYLFVKRHVLKSYTLEGDMFIRGDVDRNGIIESKDYLMIKRQVLNSYTIPQPEIVLDDDLSDYAVITVDAEGKVVSVNAEIGAAKADTAISEGGYALVIHKDAVTEELGPVLGYIAAGGEVTLAGVDFDSLAERYNAELDGAKASVTYTA